MMRQVYRQRASRIIFCISILIAFTFYGCAGTSVKQPPQNQAPTVAPELLINDFELQWLDNGGASVEATARLKNSNDVSVEGELRCTLVAINGTIDFQQLYVELLEAPPETPAGIIGKKFQGFISVPQVKLSPNQTKDWSFRMKLPEGSRNPSVPLQFFVFFIGKDAHGKQWTSKKSFLLKM